MFSVCTSVGFVRSVGSRVCTYRSCVILWVVVLLIFCICVFYIFFFFFSSRRRHTRCSRDWEFRRVLFRSTFFINSLAHVHGSQRYVTGDDSRNNWWLAVITLGEGWHNNHHAYQRSTRQGFRWYEFDPTFYVLTALAWVRVVWELGTPPEDVVRNERRLGRAVVEKVAHQLAASFSTEAIATRVREAIAHAAASPAVQDLKARAAAGHLKADEFVAAIQQ